MNTLRLPRISLGVDTAALIGISTLQRGCIDVSLMLNYSIQIVDVGSLRILDVVNADSEFWH